MQNSEHNVTCETMNCDTAIFAACTKYLVLLCYAHFTNDDDCSNHSLTISPTEGNVTKKPRDFVKEGSLREEPRPLRRQENKQKVKQTLRNPGKGYIFYTIPVI